MVTADLPTKTHILIFPFPAQGHMIPMLDFTDRLAVHGGSALTLTVLVTPKNLSLLSSLLSRHPSSVQTLNIPFPPHPLIPTGVENVKNLPPSVGFTAMIHALGQLRASLLHWITTHHSPPAAIVSDILLGWTHSLAAQVGIRRFVFSPSGAITCCVLNHLWSDMPRRKDDEDEEEVMEFEKVPNCPKYPWSQVSNTYRGYVEGDPFWEFIKDGFRDNAACHGLVVNSFAAVERVYLDHLNREMGCGRVWAVGPLLPTPPGGGGGRGGPTSVPVDEVMAWFDARGDDRVVYVCFGSQTVLNADQMAAIANGLEKSGIHFVWAVKEPIAYGTTHGMIPEGFEDRVADRGLVIRGWAPQVPILNHRAVGAFLTHCGWNSVVEALVAGVLMLTWPMMADQFIDATLIVDQLRVGMRACEGADSVPNPDELARVLVESVSENRVERERAKKLSWEAAKAIKEGGSSAMDLDAFVKHLIDPDPTTKHDHRSKTVG